MEKRNMLNMQELIIEQGSANRMGYSIPKAEFCNDQALQFESYTRETPPQLPEVSEPEVVRHYTRLSQLNYSVDTHMYPLGSCTMKFNPRFTELAALRSPFANAHPYEPDSHHQDILKILHEMNVFLGEITGLPSVTLQPAAGAQGELTGLMLIRALLTKRGNARKYVLVPDTAHGTNPASSALCGYKVRPVKSSPEGILIPEYVQEVMDEDVAAIMITNPNTLGIFEEHIKEIAEIVHARGGLVYMDGANMNALMGAAKPAHLGVDVMHLNLHKTFSTPHGGGGPGSGPVAATKELEPFMPIPIIKQDDGTFSLEYDCPDSIGRLRSFIGNFGVLLKAYLYIRELGGEGLTQVSQHAVLSANYIRKQLSEVLHLKYGKPCLHECVFDESSLQELGITTMDLAKRLIDYGFHPPTVYFPLVVNGAIMIEPTETEPLEILDKFCDAVKSIIKEAQEDPEFVKHAPYTTPVSRLDEVSAAKNPCLTYCAG